MYKNVTWRLIEGCDLVAEAATKPLCFMDARRDLAFGGFGLIFSDLRESNYTRVFLSPQPVGSITLPTDGVNGSVSM